MSSPVAVSFEARGHPRLLATHPTTLEFTRDPHLTSRGDCIVGVSASTSLPLLPVAVRRILSSDDGRGRITLTVRGDQFALEGRGGSQLTLTHPSEMVVRKSNFVSDRTLMIFADKAAKDLPRRMVKFLQNPEETVKVDLLVWKD